MRVNIYIQNKTLPPQPPHTPLLLLHRVTKAHPTNGVLFRYTSALTTIVLRQASMAPFQVLDREEQPPNPLWKYSVLTQVLCLVVSGVLLLMRCYVRLGYSTPPKSWWLEDCKDSSQHCYISNLVSGLVVVSFVSNLTRDRVAVQV